MAPFARQFPKPVAISSKLGTALRLFPQQCRQNGTRHRNACRCGFGSYTNTRLSPERAEPYVPAPRQFQCRVGTYLVYKFLIARTSRAGVLSPVQLINRGALRMMTTYPSFR